MRLVTAISLLLLLPACNRDRPENPNQLGEVLPGPVTIEQGGISANALNDKLAKVHPAMQSCYSKTLQESPKAEGAIDFTLRSEKTGLVADVTKNTVPDPSLTQCLIEAVKSMDFSADSGGTPVFVAKWSLSLKNHTEG